jgi:hypothetical protein
VEEEDDQRPDNSDGDVFSSGPEENTNNNRFTNALGRK